LLRINIRPPNNADLGVFYGVKVYYRLYQPGVLTEFKTKTIVPVPHTAAGLTSLPAIYFGQGKWSVDIPGLTTYPDVYEFVIVPIVNNSGTRAEGRNALHTKGTLGNVPAIWTSMETTKALNLLTVIPEDPQPVANVIGWKRVYKDSLVNTYKSYYYELKVQVPTNVRNIQIYRRDNSTGYLGAATVSNNYTGLGRWERIQVTFTAGVPSYQYAYDGANTPTYDSGTQVLTLNLRGPTGYHAFDQFWGNLGHTKLYDSQYGPAFESGTGYYPVPLSDQGHEFLVQIWTDITNTSASPKALLLPKISYKSGSSTIDGLATAKPTVVAVADYETFSSKVISGQFLSFKRKLTEAENQIAPSNLLISKYESISPLPTATPGVI